jgi:hypothetical protein
VLRKATLGIFVFALVVLSNFAFAENDPSLHQVYQAVQAGKMDEAQSMMNKVLQDHPNSAKAHYVEAEIFAKRGVFDKAREELSNAERLEPRLSFAKPQAVQDLKNSIAIHPVTQHSEVNNFQPAASNNFPWGMIFLGVGVIGIIFLIIRSMSSRNSANFPANMQPRANNSYAAPGQPYGSGGFGQMAPPGGGLGSGIMGGLATGAAVGVGVVAGEALAHHFMDGNNSSMNTASAATDTWSESSNNVGGTDFGIADNSSWDDSNVADVSDVGGGDWS